MVYLYGQWCTCTVNGVPVRSMVYLYGQWCTCMVNGVPVWSMVYLYGRVEKQVVLFIQTVHTFNRSIHFIELRYVQWGSRKFLPRLVESWYYIGADSRCILVQFLLNDNKMMWFMLVKIKH